MKIRTPGPMRPHLVLPEGYQPRVMLGYPFGGTVHGPFHQSVLALHMWDITRPARTPGSRPLLLLNGWSPESGLYVEDNRQRIATKFLEHPEKPDWCVQIDTDVSFPPTIVETLLDIAGRDKKVVGLSVPLGSWPSCGLRRSNIPGKWHFMRPEELSPEGTQVDGFATPLFIVHRDVIEAIADREGQTWFLRKAIPRLEEERSRLAWLGKGPMRDRQFINAGEDLAFCMRAVEAGFDIWCARVPGLRHNKTLPLSHDNETPEAA